MTVDADSDLYSYNGCIGYENAATGVATVKSAGSTWTNGRYLYVGYYGSGKLNIADGAAASSAASLIGAESGSTGVVTVEGAASAFTNSGYLSVGYGGNGTLNITGGGAVGNDYGYIGYQSGSSSVVIVDGAGSTWNNGPLFVGYEGRGTLNISRGAVVNSARSGWIGYHSGSTGVVTVDGAGSTWNTRYLLYIGDYGGGTLKITDGAAVTVDGSTCVACNRDSTGTVHFGNGALTTESLCASPPQLGGTGTIECRGLVSDIDLLFDSTASLRQTLTFNSQPDQNITVNLDISDPSNVGTLGAGWKGNGLLTIRDGITVDSTRGYVGWHCGSTGVVIVEGSGSTWSQSSELRVGCDGGGTLNIRDGGAVNNGIASIAYSPNSTGVVTVDGCGSTISSGSVRVGSHGSGMLNITGGAAVSGGRGEIGCWAGSTGVATVDGPGSTWTNRSRLSVGVEGSGTLKITNGGSVSSSSGYIGLWRGSTGMVAVDGVGSTWMNDSSLYVGDKSIGTLTITNGAAVSSSNTYIGGIGSDGTGVVTVDGPGSTWTNRSGLSVGVESSGTLNITNGGTVSSRLAYVGIWWNLTGLVTVNGVGSTWMNGSSLHVGGEGSGTLNIGDGGAVAAASVLLHGKSLLAIEVGNGSMLTVDDAGEMANDGTVRIIAGAGLEVGAEYVPIVAGVWTGEGAYQALGGTWDEVNHVFAVSDIEDGTAGAEMVVDLASKQRVMIDDAETGWSVGASFLAMESSTPLSFEASPIGGEILDGLEELLAPSSWVLGGWESAVAGDYAPGDPAYLSFDVGAGYSRGDLVVWHRDGADWERYAASDLTYDGTYVSFTVTDFSGYAVTTVPEPGTMTLLLVALALAALLADKRRRGRLGGAC